MVDMPVLSPGGATRTHGRCVHPPGRCVRPSLGRGSALYCNLELDPDFNCLILDFTLFDLSKYDFVKIRLIFFF